MKIVGEVNIPGGRASMTLHTLNTVQIGPASKLRIVQFEGEVGFYLIRYDSREHELADTLHDTVQQAIEQAEFEYSITPKTWEFAKLN